MRGQFTRCRVCVVLLWLNSRDRIRVKCYEGERMVKHVDRKSEVKEFVYLTPT